jgi:hypothetical protein
MIEAFGGGDEKLPAFDLIKLDEDVTAYIPIPSVPRSKDPPSLRA